MVASPLSTYLGEHNAVSIWIRIINLPYSTASQLSFNFFLLLLRLLLLFLPLALVIFLPRCLASSSLPLSNTASRRTYPQQCASLLGRVTKPSSQTLKWVRLDLVILLGACVVYIFDTKL